MIKRITLLVISALLTVGLFAAERTVEEAAAIAAQFTNQQPTLRRAHKAPRTAATMRLAHTRTKSGSEAPAFYVFDQEENNGFIIVSADDRTEEVLAYTDHGAFPENIPSNVQFMLNLYADRISKFGHAAAVRQATAAATYTPIAPLLGGIEWDQDAPYWNQCPMDQLDNTRCYTGCVATAAAQIMRYWQWPEQGTGSKSYTWENCLQFNSRTGDCARSLPVPLSVDFGATTYDWANMPEKTSQYNTNDKKNAVATLMYHCGVACEMSYGGRTAGGSGAYTDDMGRAFYQYFGYKRTLQCVDTYNYGRQTETATQTAAKFRTELAAGRPILVGGADEDMQAGHEFVFDGLDASGKFHVNWGWSGSCNGYYSITGLTPEELGIGAGDYGDYSYYLDYVIGIEPDRADPTPGPGPDPEPEPDPTAIDLSATMDIAQARYTTSSEIWTIGITNYEDEYPYVQAYLWLTESAFAGEYTVTTGEGLYEYETYVYIWPDETNNYVILANGTLKIVHVDDAADDTPIYRYILDGIGDDGQHYTMSVRLETYVIDDSDNWIETTDPVQPDPVLPTDIKIVSETPIEGCAAVKRICGGQLIIEHNGQRYNAQGMLINGQSPN